mgnify:CR=1 FL=1
MKYVKLTERMKKYWLSPKISYKSWKAICDKFPDSGPKPKEVDKILWEMLRDRKINICLDNSDDPIQKTLKPINNK